METDINDNGIAVDMEVLIVPCGMETTIFYEESTAAGSINCTLRNGNDVKKGDMLDDTAY